MDNMGNETPEGQKCVLRFWPILLVCVKIASVERVNSHNNEHRFIRNCALPIQHLYKIVIKLYFFMYLC